jgi:uncharacterized membrane protein YvlD (DUF360 family)
MLPKEWYKSKVFWFNVLALIVMLASAFGFEGFELDAQWQEVGAVLISVINLVLRFLTQQPLARASTVRAMRMRAPRG